MNLIPKSFPLYLSLVLLALNFSSCDEESFTEITEITPEAEVTEEMPDALFYALRPPSSADPDSTTTQSNDGRRGCFQFVYPISMQLATGDVLTAESPEELRTLADSVRTARIRANFVYPLTIVFGNGAEVTLRNYGQFRSAQARCLERDGDRPDEPCFTYVFPLDLRINGDSVRVNDGEEWRAALTAAGDDPEVDIIFPILVITIASDEPIQINRQRELNRLRRLCRGYEEEDAERCLEYIFPVQLILNGDTILVNNLREWREDVADAGEDATVDIVFPLKVILNGGRELVINDNEQLRRAWADCGGPRGDDDSLCFRYVFPLDLSVDGEVVTIDSIKEWRTVVMEAGEDADISIVFPIQVTFRGQNLTLANENQLRRLWTTCGGPHNNDRPCFRYLYPINIVVGDDTVTVRNLNQWRRASAAADFFRIVFPIRVAHGNERIVVENIEQLRELRAACNEEEGERCYAYQFPLNLRVNGNAVTVDNRSQLRELEARVGPNARIKVVLPTTVTIIETGEQITLNNPGDWRKVREACQ